MLLGIESGEQAGKVLISYGSWLASKALREILARDTLTLLA